MNDDKKPVTPESLRPMNLALNLGWQIAVPLVLFALLGRFADNYFDTAPWLLVGGVIVAAFSSSYLVYRKVAKLL